MAVSGFWESDSPPARLNKDQVPIPNPEFIQAKIYPIARPSHARFPLYIRIRNRNLKASFGIILIRYWMFDIGYKMLKSGPPKVDKILDKIMIFSQYSF